MTLLDLWKLLWKNWVLIVALPVACALVCLGVLCALPPTYSAGAVLVATGNTSVLASTATSVAYQKSAETGLEVEAKSTANRTITITASGGPAQECIDVANAAAAQTRDLTLQYLEETSEADSISQEVKTAALEALANSEEVTSEDTAFYALALLTADDTTISITEATAATNASPIKSEYLIIAAIAGLLVALAIVIIKDMSRGSVHNAYEVEENYDLRLLGQVRASARRRSGAAAEAATLLAAMDFAGEGKPAICLVPMESSESAKLLVAELESAAEAADKRVACEAETANLTLSDPDAIANALTAQAPADADVVFVMAPPVADSADFAYLAAACGCAVLVLEAMRTKRAHLESTLRQLALSKTDIVGFVMVSGS